MMGISSGCDHSKYLKGIHIMAMTYQIQYIGRKILRFLRLKPCSSNEWWENTDFTGDRVNYQGEPNA